MPEFCLFVFHTCNLLPLTLSVADLRRAGQAMTEAVTRKESVSHAEDLHEWQNAWYLYDELIALPDRGSSGGTQYMTVQERKMKEKGWKK